MEKISIVIPALNEEDGIEKTIRAIPKDRLESMGYDVQILVVDNGSSDNTAALARAAGADVVYESRRGYGNAFKAGFRHADGDIIATTDADLTYPVEDYPELIQILTDEHLDFITTDRFAHMKNGVMSFRNRMGNTILSMTMRFLFNINIKDSQSGMWIFRSSILDDLQLKSNTPLSQEIKIEACHFGKFKWKEVPIEYRPRIGDAKLGNWKVGFTNLCNLVSKRIIR